jgi:hypothetical protein
MRSTARLIVGTALVGGIALGAAPASAQEVCDPYSKSCVNPSTQTRGETGGVAPATQVRSDARPSSLPFTGGEVALAAALGAAALASGGALVVAGRRRSGASEAA